MARTSDHKLAAPPAPRTGSAPRSRARPSGPRLAVFRSNKHISAQLIDDAPAAPWPPPRRSSRTCGVAGESGGGNIDGRRGGGHLLASRAKAAGITTVVFDRGGFAYHGRVAALADAARAEGLEF